MLNANAQELLSVMHYALRVKRFALSIMHFPLLK